MSRVQIQLVSATKQEKSETTMQTVVVNINKEPCDVYIGRAGRGEDGYYGNPFRVGNGISREDAVRRFQRYFVDRIEKDSEFKRRVLALKGKRLGCFCKPKACHGDLIAVMKMMGISRRASTIRCCRSSPLRPGSRTSSTRQPGTSVRVLRRNSCAEANPCTCSPQTR